MAAQLAETVPSVMDPTAAVSDETEIGELLQAPSEITFLIFRLVAVGPGFLTSLQAPAVLRFVARPFFRILRINR